MTTVLQIDLLGEFRVETDDGTPVPIPQARRQALLAYLLLHRHAPQARRHLAFLLWPDSRETQALTNLRKALTHLRQHAPLLAQSIYTDHQVIQWRPVGAYQLDVAALETTIEQATQATLAGEQQKALVLWGAAAALYAGPLLPSCYDDWLLAERERLHHCCLDALVKLVEGHEAQQAIPTAIRYAQQLLRLEPLHEPAYRQLMRLQLRQGDRAAALRTYQTCATLLASELDVEPTAETKAMYNRLRKQGRTDNFNRRQQPVIQLVGRTAEWHQLQHAWQVANSQRAQVACLGGEAGIGKSYLAEALLEWADHQGFIVARTRAYAGEGQLAYAPVIDWLRTEPFRAVRQQLAPLWLSEVARLMPELLIEQPTIPTPNPMTEPWQRQHLWEALARALLAAEQPLLLVFDDLQWCDRETLEWLQYLLHFAPSARFLIVGTLRREEIDDNHPLHALCRHLHRAEQLTEIELRPLDVEQTAQLINHTSGEALAEAVHQALYHATTGNPLFIVEMIRAGWHTQSAPPASRAAKERFPTTNFPQLPPKVQAVIQGRLAQLSPTARGLAQLAAVIGQEFTYDLLLQAGDYHEDELAVGLDELWQRRIIREHDTYAYDFSHDRIRDVAYAEIRLVQRRLLHRQIATALERHATVHETISGALAFHYEQAGLVIQAIQHYGLAGNVARGRYAYTDAVHYLQRAITLLDRLPVTEENTREKLEMLVSSVMLVAIIKGFAAPEVGEITKRALDLCRLVDDPLKRYFLQNRLLWYHANRSEFALAEPLAEANLALARNLQTNEMALDARTSVGSIQFHQGNLVPALHHLEEALVTPLATTLRTGQLASDMPHFLTLATSAICYWLLGYPEQAAQRVQQTEQLLNAQNSPAEKVAISEFSLMVHYFLHDIPALRTLAEEIAITATQYEFSMYRALAKIHIGFARAHQGEPLLGSTQLEQSLDDVKQTAVRLFIPYNLGLIAEVHALAGDPHAMNRAVEEALALVEQTGETWWHAELLRLRGQVLLAMGAAAHDVEFWYQQARQIAQQQQAKSLELRAATSLARLWQQQSRHAEAHELLAEIYDWFTEGWETADLQNARMLLNELAPPNEGY